MHLAQALDDRLADNVVRQAGERLSTDDVWRARLNEVAHLSGEQPALAHRVAERKDLFGLLGQLIDVGVWLKAL